MAPTFNIVAPKFRTIDDQDPTVNYTGTWVFAGGPDAEYNATHSSSVVVGDFFIVPFTGTAIGVYGTLQGTSPGSQTSYAIGGGPATTVTAPSSGNDNYAQLFWQSDTLPNQSHTLVVKIFSVNPIVTSPGTVYFDYFNVTSDDASTISGPATPGYASTTSSATSTAPSSPSPSSTNGTKKSSHSGLIGGIIGALFVCIFIFILAGVLYRRKRRSQSSPKMSSEAASNSPPSIQPVLSNQVRMELTQSSISPSSSIPSSGQKSLKGGALSVVGGSTVDARANSDSVADLKRQQQQVVNSYEQVITRRAPAAPTQHVDSGVRLLDPTGPDASDIPPVYTPN
ncbi:hypothetical protein B0H19DRAFT_1265590 [Mycena capillaripes]|nr:hypothetical protein B0H19DRAFT_1265590 [Mycena capillaripes]